MDLELGLYIHGLPCGFQYNGAADEKTDFFNGFCVHPRGINEMRIKAVGNGEKSLFYYTYVLGRNVFDNGGGHKGVYFGLTLRLAAYYRRALNLYFLLDTFFHTCLGGSVLKEGKRSKEFVVSDFNNLDDPLSCLKRLVQMAVGERDMLQLRTRRTADEYARLNLMDADNDTVMRCMRQKGEVSISRAYPMKSVRQLSTRKDVEIEALKKQNQEHRLNAMQAQAHGDDAERRIERLVLTLHDTRNELLQKDCKLRDIGMFLDRTLGVLDRISDRMQALQLKI